jgi:chemotaxis protein CheX
MKAEIINPFLVSTVNVLQTMARLKATPGKPSVKDNNRSWGVVSGVIGMASDKLKGHMVVSFEERCILKVVSNMFNEEIPTINKDVVDAVGEITNMICGGAKTALSEMGTSFNMAIPLVISGKDIEIAQLSAGPVLSIPFTTEAGNLVVEASLVSQ